ncbi:MAG: hypothetical protein HY814_06100 [Candidatus Riflebacteria bacterium]|nr:hypothetical protein [Candidatus Riflebacteria bacterium]
MEFNRRLLELARRLGLALDAAGVDYALGGALAFGIWGEPRGTKDIDLATYVRKEELERVFSTLQQTGAEVDRSACRWELENWGHFEVDLEGIRVDVFLPDFPLYDWAHPRRRQIAVGESRLWFWAAEDILLFKLLFFRAKDKLDIETLLKVQRRDLDLQYIRKALREIFQDEERSEWLEHAVGEILGP